MAACSARTAWRPPTVGGDGGDGGEEEEEEEEGEENGEDVEEDDDWMGERVVGEDEEDSGEFIVMLERITGTG